MNTLLILVSAFAMKGMPNHAKTARNLRRSFRSAVADARLIDASDRIKDEWDVKSTKGWLSR
jgi:hypothetical protein